jgi:hypothetical protein
MNKRHLLIIGRRVPLMYASLKQSFAGHADMTGSLIDDVASDVGRLSRL